MLRSDGGRIVADMVATETDKLLATPVCTRLEAYSEQLAQFRRLWRAFSATP